MEKFVFEKNGSSKTGQLYEQSFNLFSDTKFEAKIKLAKPLMLILPRSIFYSFKSHNGIHILKYRCVVKNLPENKLNGNTA